MPSIPTVLIVGASRGLGYAMAAEFARRDWHVIATVRSGARAPLHDLADAYPAGVEIETLDVNDADQIAALRNRLVGRTIDILFVNAGTTTRDEHITIGAVSTEEFTHVMLTNVLGPLRVVEAFLSDLPQDALVGVMSSGQGSIANNQKGLRDVYRGSKAALNMIMRSVAARHPTRAMLLLAPGWIRTRLGGPDAPYTLEESAPILVDLLLAGRGRAGLRYIDRSGDNVPW